MTSSVLRLTLAFPSSVFLHDQKSPGKNSSLQEKKVTVTMLQKTNINCVTKNHTLLIFDLVKITQDVN